MGITSEAENIENTANCIMDAFNEMSVEAGGVLAYPDLYPFLQERYPKYKDVQKEAEQHLAKAGFVNPAPEGLMLTQVGYKAIQSKKAE
ncbi:hypothetical protein [Pontibacter beigongshangensis]|uniref:hypothetical protein n=1 Tax=Pontibacter beigongshangensis TaxID=2574733 RepID=UPI001F514A2F|nr:hypothetical protein [Pontibacter beigongshangensis]